MMRRVLVLATLLLSAWLGADVAAEQGRSNAPRAAVYPHAAPRVQMSHATPAHAQLACTACHDAAETSVRASDSLRPGEARCVPCHAAQIDRARPSAEACGTCHAGFDPRASPTPLIPSAAPTGSAASATLAASSARLHFSHQRHREQPCVSCHAKAATGMSLPTMQVCLDCHRGARELPCKGCHLTLPNGRLRTSFPDGKLVPSGPLLGMAHDADFGVRHRWLAADHGGVCASCHVEEECTACHDGRVRPRGLHPSEYIASHAQDAQRDRLRCTSCHTTQSFCAPCHARLGVSSMSAPKVASGTRFHPPGSQWLRGPNSHGVQARRALETCTSCHAERDCVTCHGSSGIGAGGLSPHPPTFFSACGAYLAQNPSACVRCHGSLESLRVRCR